jgi:hypothetical protein
VGLISKTFLNKTWGKLIEISLKVVQKCRKLTLINYCMYYVDLESSGTKWKGINEKTVKTLFKSKGFKGEITISNLRKD